MIKSPPRRCLSHKNVGTSILVVDDDDDGDDTAVEENSHDNKV